MPEYVYPKHSVPDYLGILVPNVDNVRSEFLMDTIVKQFKCVLLIGEQGSAKTVIVQGYCAKYDPEVNTFKSFNFSSASTPFMFQVDSLASSVSLYTCVLQLPGKNDLLLDTESVFKLNMRIAFIETLGS